jgi:hypothetical protein
MTNAKKYPVLKPGNSMPLWFIAHLFPWNSNPMTPGFQLTHFSHEEFVLFVKNDKESTPNKKI